MQTNSAFLKVYDELADEFAQIDEASKSRKQTAKQGSLLGAEVCSEVTSKAKPKS